MNGHWNKTGQLRDYLRMDCEIDREAQLARLDARAGLAAPAVTEAESPMISGVTAERSLAVSLARGRSAAVVTVKRSATVVASLALTALLTAAPASAHVTVTADHTWRAGVAMVTFMVPNESETGSPTTQFRVALPNVTSAHTELMPGWTAQLDHDIPSGTFRSATWTATPDAGIPADEFALFRIQVNLPDSDTASFPATQIYADGKTVHWDQPPLPDGSEPEHPAPTLKLTAAAAEKPPPAPDSDPVTRWLAGAALAIAVGSAALVVARWRRS